MGDRGTESALSPVRGTRNTRRLAKRAKRPRPSLDPRWKEQLRATLNALKMSNFGEK